MRAATAYMRTGEGRKMSNIRYLRHTCMNLVHVALTDFYEIWYITSLLTLEKQVLILSHIGL
jgi:hypothetical protein